MVRFVQMASMAAGMTMRHTLGSWYAGPFLVPVLQHGPNNQIIQFLNAVAIARYSGLTVIEPDFFAHWLERDVQSIE